MHPLLILIVLLAVIFTVRWVKAQPPEKRQKAGFTAALVGACALLLVALATGKLNPLVAAIAAAIPAIQRLTWAKSVYDNLRSSVKGNGNKERVMTTARLRVAINTETDDWTGVILDGPHKGATLGTLDHMQLSELLNVYQREDPESAALLEAYLARLQRTGPRSGGPHDATITTMDVREACQVLGINESATDDDVIAAHRRLMQRMHPDRGGSDYLASQINRAKEVLLKRS